MGSLFKQIYRYTHPRSYRHNENLWPYMKIKRATTGEINSLHYRGKKIPIVNLSALRNAFSGPIVLAASGPSINEINFDNHPSIPAMGVNGAWFLDNVLNFSLYTIVDMGFFDKKPEIIAQIINNPKVTLFTTAHGIARIFDGYGLDNTHCQLALIEDAAFRIHQASLKPSELKKTYQNTSGHHFPDYRDDIGFATNICNGIFDAGTVVYWALQIIFFLGFEKIFILGLDMNNFNKPRFYESDNNKLPTDLEGMVDNIIFPALLHANNVLEENNRKAFNLSINSSVPNEIFQKVSYDDAFFKKD